MANPRRGFESFCLKHRNKGIPNLMLFVVLGSGLVYLMSLTNGGYFLYDLLTFDKAMILQGQVWRLVTWVFTEILHTNPFLNILFLFFFYWLGRSVEASVGTLKFNLFYFGGVLLMDAFAMIFCPMQDVIIGRYLVTPADLEYLVYGRMAFYLHLSLVLAFATTHPDSRFYIFFIIPISAWVMALIYLVLIGIEVFNLLYPAPLLPHALFPLVGLLNYFLFYGRQMSNLLPMSWRVKMKRSSPKTQRQRTQAPRQTKGKTIPFPQGQQRGTPTPANAPYTHRCTVCGRTDVSHPELEFRYCSRCHGYHCYCQDHIGNHEHITE